MVLTDDSYAADCAGDVAYPQDCQDRAAIAHCNKPSAAVMTCNFAAGATQGANVYAITYVNSLLIPELHVFGQDQYGDDFCCIEELDRGFGVDWTLNLFGTDFADDFYFDYNTETCKAYDATLMTQFVKVEARDGADLIVLANNNLGNAFTVYGDAGADTVQGSPLNDVIYGGTQNDTLYGNGLDDDLYGESGNDTLYGGDGDDDLYGGDDVDTIYGQADDDRVRGGNQNDTIQGGAGDDTLCGDGGTDTIVEVSGTNYIWPGVPVTESVSQGTGTDYCDTGYACDFTTTIPAFCL